MNVQHTHAVRLTIQEWQVVLGALRAISPSGGGSVPWTTYQHTLRQVPDPDMEAVTHWAIRGSLTCQDEWKGEDIAV